MTNKRYFLTDLDGTLLRSDASLSPFTLQMMTEALDQGAVLSYATARSYFSSNLVAGAIPWRFPIILYNGALLYDPITRQAVGGHSLDHALTEELLSVSRSHGVMPLFFTLNEQGEERVLHEKLRRPGELFFAASRPGDQRFREVEQLSGFSPDAHHHLILTYIGSEEELEPLRQDAIERFGSRIHLHIMRDTYMQDQFFLEISHPKANKGDALRSWAALVGCDPLAVTVFGDQLNDEPMFAAAGRRCAPSNAHPRLLAMADDILPSHNEDGVARHITRIMLDARSGEARAQ